MSFVCTQFKCQAIFYPQIGPYQVLPLRVRVNLGAMRMKEDVIFPKDPGPFSVIYRTLVGGVLHLCRDAVGVFYSPCKQGYRTLVGGVLPLCRDALGLFYSPCQLGYRTLVGGVLPLCRDAVGVFYSPCKLGYRTLVGGVLPL